LTRTPPPPVWGLGRSIYSPQQLEAFYAFQQSSAVRAAYIADASELAFSRRSANGEWGLPISEYGKHAIVDLVGLSFIPLYRFLGPVSMIIILVLFFITITRLTITVLFRIIVLGRTRGCGFWILAAFLGCVYQIVISPLEWADRKAKDMAEKVEARMIAKGEEQGDLDTTRQLEADLEDMRQRENKYLYWHSWCRKGFDGQPEDSPVAQDREAELVRLDGQDGQHKD
jgi:hypothetical protein